VKSEIVVCPGRKGLRPIIIQTTSVSVVDHRFAAKQAVGPQGTRIVRISLPRIPSLEKELRR